jgi:hypothetical protein
MCGGCGGGGVVSTTPTGLRLQRDDLVVVARALKAVQRETAQEVQATKAAWRSVADGLPEHTASVPASLIRAAAHRATTMRNPGLLEERKALSLTGPASGISGLYRAYSSLAGRGWHMIGGALEEIERGRPAGARFARDNVALYIVSVYDAHFGLAQIGKRMLSAYAALGGPRAFGKSLTDAEVTRLANAYSEANDRLHPHPGVHLGS